MHPKEKKQLLSQTQRLSFSQKLGLDPRQIPYQKYLQMPLYKLTEEINSLLGDGELANPALERVFPSVSIKNRKGLTSKQIEEKRWGLKESRSYSSSDPFQDVIEGTIASKSTLKEHLLFQLHIHPLDEELMKAGELLIGNLDEQGFFQKKVNGETIYPQEVLQLNRISLSAEECEKLLSLIRRFDPVGVCVENQWESLKIQAELKGGAPDSFWVLMEAGERFLASGKEGNPTAALPLSEAQLLEAKEFLATLNLQPATAFSVQEHYLYPEMELALVEGKPVVRVDDSYSKGLRISNEYQQMAIEPGKENEALRKFALAQMDEAKLFLDALEFRQKSLASIGYKLLELQKDFFLKGPAFLKRVTQKEMATLLNLDETRISRLVNEKSVKTSWGIFPLKYFFSAGGVKILEGTNSSFRGETVLSRNGIKARILSIQKEFGEKNEKNKKLSDQKIADILKGEGIEIARRTVAKYRSEMNLPSF